MAELHAAPTPLRQARHRLPRRSRPPSHHPLAQTVKRRTLGRVGKPDSGGLGEAGRMTVRQEISEESWAVLAPLFPVW